MADIWQWQDQQQYDDWCNDLVRDSPESWDGDDAQESIVTEYVHELERRLLALGGSLERHAAADSRISTPDELRQAYAALAEMEERLVAAAQRLQREGYSYAALAAPFGITRQAARKRWPAAERLPVPEGPVAPVRREQHLSECYLANYPDDEGAHCTCLDWSPEI